VLDAPRDAYDVEVVAEQHDRDALTDELRQLADHLVAGERVLARGRLVGDDDRGIAEQGLGQDEPLLLASGELVRVAAQERPVGRQAGAAQRRLHGRAVPGGDLRQHGADAPHGVEHRRRVLRDEAHGSGRGRPARADLTPGHPDRAGHLDPRRVLAEQRESGGGLAAAGLTDQREHLPCGQVEAHAVQDRRGPQVPDVDHVRPSGRERRPADSARSKVRLSPTDNATISSAGTTTAQGWRNNPPRLRSTMTAQSAASGATPMPRKLAAATR
jgi:hypothetical protein